MRVAIINTARKGTEVHAAECADVAKSEKRNKDQAWVIDVDSRLAVSHNYWADQISDTVDPESAEGWATAESWMGEFNFLPCCTLPHGKSPFEKESIMNDAAAHKFAPGTDKTKCAECGKTRNAKLHKAVPAAEPAPAPEVTEEELAAEDAAVAEDEIAAEDEEWGIPPVPPFQPGEAEAPAAEEAAETESPAAEDEPATEAPAPAKEVLKSHWASKMLVEAAIEAGGTLGAKFEAAKASKTGSRSVRLTRAECDALAAIATDVETAAVEASEGRKAHSARTLRERLAASWA